MRRIIQLAILAMLLFSLGEAQEYRKPTVDDANATACGGYSALSAMPNAYEGSVPSTATSSTANVSSSTANQNVTGCRVFYSFPAASGTYTSTTLTVSGSISATWSVSTQMAWASIGYSVNGTWTTLTGNGPWTVTLPSGVDPRTVQVRVEMSAAYVPYACSGGYLRRSYTLATVLGLIP